MHYVILPHLTNEFGSDVFHRILKFKVFEYHTYICRKLTGTFVRTAGY